LDHTPEKFKNHTWGAEKKPMLNIYKSLITSQINYGSQIYNTANARQLKILNPLHHEGIQLSLGALTSPTKSILFYAGKISQ